MVVALFVLLALQVDAQSPVDNNALCGPSALDEKVAQIREELVDVKTVCASSHQQRCSVNATSLSRQMWELRQELKNVKSALTSKQQQHQQSVTPGLCEL